MANTSPFQTVPELQSLHLDFGYLSMQNYFSAHTTSMKQRIWISIYFFLGLCLLDAPSFFYFTVFTLTLPDGIFMLTIAASLQITLFYICLYIYKYIYIYVYKYHFSLAWLSLPGIDLVHCDTEICHSAKFFSQVFIFRKMFQKGCWKHFSS